MPVQFSRPSPTHPSFIPAFFQQPSSPLPGCEDLSYPADKSQTFQEFISSPDFPSFQEQYKAVLDEFSEIAKSYGLDDSNIQQVKTRLFDPQETYYGGRKKVIFGSGKRSLSKFIAQLQNESIPLDTRRDKARNLIESMGVCADGVATHVSTIASDLELLLCGEEIYRHKNIAISQLITNFVAASPNLQPPGMELHYVNKISNALAEQFGLPVQEDSWQVDQEITEDVIVDCRKYILKKLTPVTLALHFAETCVAELKNNMQSHFRDGRSDDSEESFDLTRLYEKINLTIDQQKRLYGDISMESLAGPLDADLVRYRLYTDPTLVAVDIINALKQAGRVENYSPCLLYGATSETAAIRIEGMGDLVWANEDGTAVPLTAEHLRSITPHQSVEGNHRIAAKAIENSSVASLIENLSPEWLNEREVIQLLSKAGYEDFMIFAEKHQAFFERHYPPLALAEIFIAHGDPVQFKAYMAHHCALFAHDDAMGILFQFWDPAISQHNPRMLDAVAHMAMQAMTPTTPISMCRLEMVSKLMHINLENADPGPANMQTAIIFQLGEILINACENNLIGSAQLASLLTKAGHGAPGFHAALVNGNHRQVATFGNILLQAANKKLLNTQQIATLLGAHSLGFPALSHALLQKHVPAIKAFGAIITSLYEMAVLDDKQVAGLLSCRAEDGYGRLINCMDHQDKNVISAYAKILLDIDSVKQASQNKNRKNTPLILTSEVEDEELRLGHFLYARPEETLNGLILQVGALSTMRNEAASEQTIANAHRILKMEIEKIRVQLFSKVFFCAPKQQRDSEVLFVQLMHDWDVLRGIPS